MPVRTVAATTSTAAALTLKPKRREYKVAGLRVCVGHLSAFARCLVELFNSRRHVVFSLAPFDRLGRVPRLSVEPIRFYAET